MFLIKAIRRPSRPASYSYSTASHGQLAWAIICPTLGESTTPVHRATATFK